MPACSSCSESVIANRYAKTVEFNQLRNSGRYSSGYFSDKGGGYVLVERSSMPHEKDEIEAANPTLGRREPPFFNHCAYVDVSGHLVLLS